MQAGYQLIRYLCRISSSCSMQKLSRVFANGTVSTVASLLRIVCHLQQEPQGRQCGFALKGLSHEISGPVFWPVWMHLGLNRNRFWFLSFKEAPSIWDRHFMFWCVSCHTFSEILRISEKDWQMNLWFPEIYLNWKLLWDMLMLWKNILGEPSTQLSILRGHSVANPSWRF